MGLSDLKQLKCKTCGEPLDMNTAKDGVIVCGVCDSRFTLPKRETLPEVRDYINQGEHDLDTGKFDEAYMAFNKAAELDKTEPEAYWGMALAEYKIQYLKDEVNNRLQPICHDINQKEFAESANFLKTLRYATEAQKCEYERKGEEIDSIKKEFYKIKQTGLDYDCFICVKVSGENGELTEDSEFAHRIYRMLKKNSFVPFYSEAVLKNVTGADYEAHILYALTTSETMLVICFDEAYLRTKWVKNEYTRFLKLVNDEEKESDSITLVYRGKPIEKLPGKNGKMQGIDANELDYSHRILQFVESHTPEAKRKREEAARRREEEAKRKAEADEVQRKKFAEQEERLRQLEEMIKAQQGAARQTEEEAKRKAEEEKAKKEAEEQARLQAEQAEKEREEQARREKEERERKEREEQEKVENEIAATEEEEENNINFFEIENGVLKKYHGNAEKVVIPDSVTSIGKDAFSGCYKLTSVKIPDSVTSIGKDAFSGCRELTSIKIPNSVTSIGSYAFFRCSGLTSLTIGKGVENIGFGAFSGCSGLTSISIPKSVKEIGTYAFLNCNGLTNIVIPKSVKYMDSWIFANCGNLITIYCCADNKPNGWDKEWNKKSDKLLGLLSGKHNVIWGYKGE